MFCSSIKTNNKSFGVSRKTSKDGEEERKLPGDLPQDKPNSRLIPKFNEILFYDERFFFKKNIYELINRVESLLLFQQGSLSSKDRTYRTQTFL